MRSTRAFLLAGLLWPFTPAFAVDGVIEINQQRLVAGGVTPGDAPGSPVTLSEPGSYRLTGNLVGSRGIEVDVGVSDVTIDLNGFKLDASGGSGPLIRGRVRTVVKNGMLRGGFVGCLELGNESRVIDVKTDNCGDGILVGHFSQVLRSSARNHTGIGITVGDSSSVRDSLSELNGGVGISAGLGSLLVHNISRGNAAAGLSVESDSLVAGSAVNGNTNGVDAGARAVLVSNDVSSGSISGILAGNDSVLRSNTVGSNSVVGIAAGLRNVVRNNDASRNVQDGIFAGDGSAVVHNTVSDNGLDGIECDGAGDFCGIVGNTVISNGAAGLNITTGSIGVYKKNTFTANSPDVLLGSADPGFHNTCSGAVPCP